MTLKVDGNLLRREREQVGTAKHWVASDSLNILSKILDPSTQETHKACREIREIREKAERAPALIQQLVFDPCIDLVTVVQDFQQKMVEETHSDRWVGFTRAMTNAWPYRPVSTAEDGPETGSGPLICPSEVSV